jgi:hypothetical protein
MQRLHFRMNIVILKLYNIKMINIMYGIESRPFRAKCFFLRYYQGRCPLAKELCTFGAQEIHSNDFLFFRQ